MSDNNISIEPEETGLNESELPENDNPESNDNQENKRKKAGSVRITIRITALILTVVYFVVTIAAFCIGYTRVDLEKNEYISRSELHNNPFVTNILLIGVDELSDDELTTRSDSMILLSLDFIHAKIKLASFLRDSWVKIPEHNDNKLNAAFALGGSQLLTDTLEYNFRVDIDHYIKVDFAMFTQIIDKLGGIDITIKENEAIFTEKTENIYIPYGENVHVNGEQALVYSRIRKLDTDYMRTYRQRKVIKAIIKKFRQTNIIKLLSIAKEVLPLLETDLSPFEIGSMFFKGGIATLFFKIQQIRMPTEDLMYEDYIDKIWVEIIDVEGCRERLYDFIYKSYND